MIRTRPVVAFAALAIAACAAASYGTSQTAPAVFTPAQAHEGKALYAQSCAKCHGAGLTGGFAPDLAGKSFSQSGMSFTSLHREVTVQMPLDAPASLKPDEYAAIIAFLLASNCYPSGGIPYPASGAVSAGDAKIVTQGDGKICSVP